MLDAIHAHNENSDLKTSRKDCHPTQERRILRSGSYSTLAGGHARAPPTTGCSSASQKKRAKTKDSRMIASLSAAKPVLHHPKPHDLHT